MVKSTTLLSIIESPRHPHFLALYHRLHVQEESVNSVRNANKYLKKNNPDIIVAEFFYGYSNNYSGVHISNLDVLLVTVRKYAPHTKIIVLVDKSEEQYVGQLNNIFPLAAVQVLPITETTMQSLLEVYIN